MSTEVDTSIETKTQTDKNEAWFGHPLLVSIMFFVEPITDFILSSTVLCARISSYTSSVQVLAANSSPTIFILAGVESLLVGANSSFIQVKHENLQ